MIIEITKKVETKVKIDVDFPYYYIHDLYQGDGPNMIYGKKVSKMEEVQIHESHDSFGEVCYELKLDRMNHSYFEEKYKSTKEAFDAVKARALAVLTTF